MKSIYLDNAATTAVAPEVFQAMKPYFSEKYGNASEFHRLGREAKIAIEESRRKIASFFGVKSNEIIFTASATEAINLSHKGLIESIGEIKGKIPHIITSQIEHKAVLETCRHLEREKKAAVTYLPVDRYGLVNVKDIKEAVRPETVLISIIYINNEVGTVEPIKEIGKLIKKINKERKQKIYFHTDATQAVQYLDCRMGDLGADMLSFTGHKISAPKGVGALVLKEDISIIRQIDGGAQESGQRSGTENVPYIVGMGKAIELVQSTKYLSPRIKKLRDRLINNVLKIAGVNLTGHPAKRAPHIASFVFEGVEGESVVLHLSDLGIMISSGSACTSSSLNPSHVLTAMGVRPEISHGSLRFSLNKNNTEAEIDFVSRKLPGIIKKLRTMSPI